MSLRLKKIFHAALILSLLIAVAGCGSSGEANPTPDPQSHPLVQSHDANSISASLSSDTQNPSGGATAKNSTPSSPDSGTALDNLIKVHFIDVGQADSIYIQLPHNNDILIDGGNVGDSQLVVNYLKAQGLDDIELLIATHPHEDHIGGLPAVFDAFSVEKVIDSGIPEESSIYQTYRETVSLEGCSYEVNNKQVFTWGSVVLTILTEYTPRLATNNASVISRLDTGDVEFLFMGDAGFTAESLLQGDISADILKVGHHGSYTATSVSFLSRVQPQVAIISVGADNQYGHPYPAVVSRLQSVGATVYRTDLLGNIVVNTDGAAYSVATSRDSPTSAPSITPVPGQTQSAQGMYVGSKNSNKYHHPDCSGAQQIKEANQIWFFSEPEAIAASYVPCKICKP